MSHLFAPFRELFDGHIRKLQRDIFKRRLCTVRNRDFTIISSNCIGGLLYQLLDIPYATPCVGLYFFAPCFLKFASNLREYLQQDLVQVHSSQYALGNIKRETYGMYPLGRLGDIEIHFMHYANWDEAQRKWARRAARINYDRLFFVMTDQNLCTYPILEAYNQIPQPKKVCFTAKKYDLESCVQIPCFAREDEVGNLVSNYHLFNRRFDFVRWFDEMACDKHQWIGSASEGADST